jgi:predicted regulator of Ras-like GTPase activity (Roadblock/LC7/MglB family)
MASRTEEMVRHLKALQMNTPDIEASAVVSVDCRPDHGLGAAG